MNNKIYIAGRISGIKYETAKRNFSKSERYWRNRGYEVINPTKLCNKEWGWWRCMAVCLWNLLKCDSVYFMSNSCHSRGARIEYRVAKMLGKCIYMYGNVFGDRG